MKHMILKQILRSFDQQTMPILSKSTAGNTFYCRKLCTQKTIKSEIESVLLKCLSNKNGIEDLVIFVILKQ